MFIMRKQLLILLLLIVYGTYINAQTQVINKPEKYLNPIDGVGLPSKGDIMSKKPWYVFSDRSNNPVYSGQTGQNVTKKLDLGVKLAVLAISESGNRLYVALEKDIDGKNLNPASSALGWIDSDKLVLWEKSIIDKTHSIDKKAMILFTIDNAKSQATNDGKFTTDVPIYKAPDRTTILSMHQGVFQFFPIFKREGRFLLLGESFTLDKTNEFNGLKGWVDSANISEWSHRVAWEKNWIRRSVDERKRNVDSIGIMVLRTQIEADRYANTDRKRAFSPFVSKEAPYLELKYSTDRKPGPMGRFPILDLDEIGQDDGVLNRPIKVGVIGEVMDLEGKEIDINSLYKAGKKIRDLRKVNVIFVIDATESMEPYRKAVIDGVRDALNKINKIYAKENTSKDEKNDFLFGCVLYRDNHMELITQTYGTNLTNDPESFFKWLDENMVPPGQGKNKKRADFTGTDDLEEAMYFGIQNAIDDYGPDKNTSNYMILIGDCGDHQGSRIGNFDRSKLFIDQDDLFEELQSYNMNILAFQVHHKNDPAYDLFQEQIKNILKKLDSADLITKGKLLELDPEKSSYVGKILPCEKGKTIDVSEMSRLINENIIQINEDVNAKIKDIAKVIKGIADLDPWSTAKVIKFLVDNNISQEQAEKMTKSGLNQEYEVGYTVFKPNGYNDPFFQTVVLYSRSELEEVVYSFRDLSAAIDYPIDEQRIRLKKAMEDWLPKYFSGVPANVLKDMPVGDLLERITGLKFSDKYKKITISKIVDELTVSNKLISDFVKDINLSLKQLEVIHSEVRTYSARVEIPGDTKTLFIYIPSDVFPKDN